MDNAQELGVKTATKNPDQPATLRGRLSRRTIFIALAVTGIAGGLFFGWNWLAAAGLSSLVIGLLPCAAMCAAGLCASRLGRKNACSGSAETAPLKEPGDRS